VSTAPAGDDEGDRAGANAAMAAALPALDAGEILVAEFHYAQATALQANEDRARAGSYFLATAGSVVLALLGVRLEGAPEPIVTLGFAALFLALTGIGLVTLNQLAALRLGWLDSCHAMNAIKARYVAAHPGLAGAFRWSDATLPPPFKARSLSSQLALLVALVMGLAAASATVCLLWTGWTVVAGPAGAGPTQVAAGLLAALVGLLTGVAAWRHYRRQLRRAPVPIPPAAP